MGIIYKSDFFWLWSLKFDAIGGILDLLLKTLNNSQDVSNVSGIRAKLGGVLTVNRYRDD